MGAYGLCQSAGLFRRVEDLVVEDREVESQAQADGVRGLHLLLADIESLLVRLLRVVHRGCKNTAANTNPRCHYLPTKQKPGLNSALCK